VNARNVRLSRGVRTLLAASVCGALCVAVSTGVSSAASSNASSGSTTTTTSSVVKIPAVTLQGGGAWGAYQEVVPWQNELYSAKTPISFAYTAHGSLLGRDDFVAGRTDFVLSALPFSAGQLKQLKNGAADVISAPVQVSALAFLLEPPLPDGFVSVQVLCDPDDPSTWPATVTDPSQCVVRTKYSEDVKIPPENLAAMALRYPGAGAIPLSSWNAPAVLAANGMANFTTPPLAGPAPVNRSDPDELNYFLQTYVKTAAPTVWAGVQAVDTRIPWEPITERLGRQASGSRDGVDQQSQQLLYGGDPSSGTLSNFTAGVMGPVPPSARSALLGSYPKAKLQFVSVRNAHGDWVQPTSAAISAAVDAGGSEPLYALTHDVPNAYPLTWIERMYVPAHGLSVAKTEGLANLVRYIVTDGQKVADSVGEGHLPTLLTLYALGQANKIVESNCVGPDRKIVWSNGVGPEIPADASLMLLIGQMAHCEYATAPPITTTTPTSASYDTTPTTYSSFDTTPTSDTTPTTTATPTTAAKPTTTTQPKPRYALATAEQLPLPQPASSTPTDRLLTFLLGAALYLVLRKPIARAAQRVIR
jgi:ABC-type phosphate transport system substrate-binding protein